MTYPALNISVSIDCPPEVVYQFASDPANLPLWASGLASGVREVGGEWIGDTPQGPVAIRFADQNRLGVLDHDVTLPSGETFHNPMRVFRNADGSECLFTLYRLPGVSDDEFEADRSAIERDLQALKERLES